MGAAEEFNRRAAELVEAERVELVGFRVLVEPAGLVERAGLAAQAGHCSSHHRHRFLTKPSAGVV